MSTPAILCRWNGEAFEPIHNQKAMADRHFVVGEVYEMVEEGERSMRSHRHYFASIAEAYANLPEAIAARFSNVEHFHAAGLIECGYFHEYRFACATSTDAINAVAAMVRGTPYAVASIADRTAIVRIARSRKIKRGNNGGMDKATFEAAHGALVDWAWALVGLKPDYAALHTGRAA